MQKANLREQGLAYVPLDFVSRPFSARYPMCDPHRRSFTLPFRITLPFLFCLPVFSTHLETLKLQTMPLTCSFAVDDPCNPPPVDVVDRDQQQLFFPQAQSRPHANRLASLRLHRPPPPPRPPRPQRSQPTEDYAGAHPSKRPSLTDTMLQTWLAAVVELLLAQRRWLQTATVCVPMPAPQRWRRRAHETRR